MRFLALTALSLLSTLVVSISIPGLPDCAGDCVPANLGGCGQLDVNCICNNTNLLDNLACCVSKKCDKSDQQKTINFAQRVCANSPNINNIPTTASCNKSGSSSGSSASSSAAAANTNAANSNGRFAGAGLGVAMAGLVAAL